VLIESIDDDGVQGRGEHQAPEVDGCVTVGEADAVAMGDVVVARVVDSDGVDLVAVPV
jgi:ribosomal protein S12 methylthiotransferase